jgi:hypothetical protein
MNFIKRFAFFVTLLPVAIIVNKKSATVPVDFFSSLSLISPYSPK